MSLPTSVRMPDTTSIRDRTSFDSPSSSLIVFARSATSDNRLPALPAGPSSLSSSVSSPGFSRGWSGSGGASFFLLLAASAAAFSAAVGSAADAGASFFFFGLSP